MSRRVAASLIAALLVPAGASAARGGREVEVTPVVGYRVGGTTQEAQSEADADIEGSPTFGVILDVWARDDGQYEFLYSHQSTDLDPQDGSAASPGEPAGRVGLTIDTIQAGGLLFLGPEARWRPYMAMTLGATLIDPQDSDYSGGTYFSGSLAGGLKLSASERLGVRLEVRGHGIFVSDDSEIACAGGGGGGVCFVGASGGAIWQIEATAGVALRF